MGKDVKKNTIVNEIKEYIDKKLHSGIDEVKRHTGVLFESLRSEVKLAYEQYGSFIGRFDRIENKLEEHDLRFDRIDLELKGMKTALFDNSHRLNDHEGRIRNLETRK